MEASANKNFGNRDIYQIAHEQNGELFNETIDLITELVNINGGEIKRSMTIDNEAALLRVESNLNSVQDSEYYPFNVIIEKLEIKQEIYKAPRYYEGCYYLRLSSHIDGPFDDQVFISEYYIEQFRNGTYFGSMRRFYVDNPDTVLKDVSNGESMRVLGDVESMTNYDIVCLKDLLIRHANYSNEANQIKNILSDH